MPKFVHFNPDTGEIVQVSDQSHLFEREGFKVAVPLRPTYPDFHARRYAVDLASVYEDDYLGAPLCDLVELPPEPISVQQVKMLRDAELRATDEYMVPDRPMTEEMRDQWRLYRQALRDFGTLKTALEMIAAWPERPDGRDPLCNLRAANG